jgi:RNA polymerase sigma-70 factor (ECF subfamily)
LAEKLRLFPKTGVFLPNAILMIMPVPVLHPPALITADDTTSQLRVAVRRFIGRRVTDAATADDLTQEVFLKVQRHIAKVRDPRRLMGWVIQIARTTVADYYRHARSTEVFKEEHITDRAPRPESFEQEETELREDLQAYVRTVVQALPPIYRQALVLTEYDGLSQVELARQLGLSVSAAKSRVQRARAMVREQIDRCCHVEVDRYGTVLDCTSRLDSCDCSTQLKGKERNGQGGDSQPAEPSFRG